jgi:preprotein translocase SecF subunit
MANVNVNQVSLNDVGPTWGADITTKAERALVIFLAAVVIYITFRFEGKMAIAALIALLHDILITVGIYSISGFTVSPATVIAFLTILGYSLYDTVVVFDKIEENTKGLAASGRITYTETVNLSMNQVLMRSVNTSLVAIMPILSILVIGAYALGASALQDFGLALFIGLLTGAYSSIFIAAPALAVMKEREPRYSQIRERLASRASMTGVLTPAAAASGELLGASAAGSGGGGGGRSKSAAKSTGAGARAAAGGAGGGSRSKLASRPPLKPGGLAAKVPASTNGADDIELEGGDGLDGPSLRELAKLKADNERLRIQLAQVQDVVEVTPVPVRKATRTKPAGGTVGGTDAGGTVGGSGGPGGAAESGPDDMDPAGSGAGAAGVGQQTPKPRPAGGATRSGGGGGGGNRPAPRPRKKGRHR